MNAPAIHEGYHARWDCAHTESEERNTWRAEIPLTAQGRTIGCVELCGTHDEGPVWETIAALARLPEHERLVVSLHYLESQSVARIGEVLGRPVGTVTKQLSRAIERLKRILLEVAS